ncbi:MAG: alanine racemase, partial [Desulfatiglandales bacterium]
MEIDLSAIKKNLGTIRRLVGKRVKIMAVVKADAYGHGLVQVSRSLQSEDVDCFGVFEMYEAVLLREAGIRKEICLMAGIRDREEAGLALKLDVTPVIVDLEMAEMLNFVASEHRKKIGCFLKVDTGMGRLGIIEDITENIIQIARMEGLVVAGLMSHFSD